MNTLRLVAHRRLIVVASLLGGALVISAARRPSGRPATTTVTGLIVDPVTGAPIPDVVITTDGSSRSARTGLDGRFLLTGLTRGARTIHVGRSGYMDFMLHDTAAAPDTLHLDVELHPDPTPLQVTCKTMRRGPNPAPCDGPMPLLIVRYSGDSVAALIALPQRVERLETEAEQDSMSSLEAVGHAYGMRNWGRDGSGGAILITRNGTPPFSWVR